MVPLYTNAILYFIRLITHITQPHTTISNGELGANREFRRSNYALTDGMFRWLVYDEYPIDVSRPAAKDNDTYLTPGGFAWIKIFLRWICPVLIVVCGCVIWVMRRMK